MNKPTIIDKLYMLIKSSKEYRGLLLIGFLFIFTGSILIYIGLHFNIIFLVIFGGIFISFSLFFLINTLPSSILYQYEKIQIKKYGHYINACIKEKEITHNSYYEKNNHSVNSNKKNILLEELNYILIFSFEYQNQLYENSDFVEKNEYEMLNIGDFIPIKFLTIEPKKSSIRKIKLKRSMNKKTVS